jgi:hypothetical protein
VSRESTRFLNRSFYGADTTVVSTPKQVLQQQVDANRYAIDERAVASAILARARLRAAVASALAQREARQGSSRTSVEHSWRPTSRLAA